MKTANELSQWYNEAFFDGTKKVDTVISVTLKHESGTLEIPGIKIQADNSIHEIISAYHTHLKAEPRKAEEVKEKPKTEEVTPPIDFGLVEYRNNEYLVEETEEDNFVVLRKKDRSPISIKSPLAKGVIKIFKSQKR